MSSSDHLHPGQLQMFMPAGELRAMKPSDGCSGETDEWVWNQKQNEDQYLVHVDGKDERIGESIRKRGVLRPVQLLPDKSKDSSGRRGLFRKRVLEGHHRVAIAAAHDPTMEIPVVHL